MRKKNKRVLIIGGGPAGLATAQRLVEAGREVKVFEAAEQVGGLSATLRHGAFRYDIGGHRFFTQNAMVRNHFLDSLRGDVVQVERRSQIYFHGRFFTYPLSFWNALLGMGALQSVQAGASYIYHRLLNRVGLLGGQEHFAGYVTAQMGKRLFQQFFEDYTEKVWGISCQELSSDWAAQRIKGLDLAVAIKGALGMLTKRPVTLVDRFDYPRLGIGLLSDRMSAAVRQGNGKVECGAKVSGMESAQGRIGAIQLANGTFVEADDFVMTGPLTQVARWLSPDGIGWGADRLRWRGLITVFLELDMPRLSRSHWIYFPDREIPFGRLHEPKNWSRDMAPANRTGIVVEYFASPQDQRWLSSDDDLIRLTGDVLGELKFIQPGMVRGGRVDRFVHAYPTYTVGYQQWVNGIYRRLRGFGNLSLSGRTGLFRYHNIDHAIETGWETSKQILTGDGDPYRVNQARAYLEDANHVE